MQSVYQSFYLVALISCQYSNIEHTHNGHNSRQTACM